MFATAVRIEHDLGVPSVSLNALTGHRSCAPEDCNEHMTISPQGPAPVSGVFPAGDCCTFWRLGFRQFGFRHITRTPRRAAPYTWARPPVSWHAIFPSALSDSGKPSDPEISPLISARYAGDTAVRLMAHSCPSASWSRRSRTPRSPRPRPTRRSGPDAGRSRPAPARSGHH